LIEVAIACSGMEQRADSAAARTVDDYLAALPDRERAVLQKLRETIRSAAPEAEEVISYRIPLYKHHGHLVGFAAFRNHCSLFVTNSAVRDQFAKELEPYKVEGTTVRFTVEKPLPTALVKRIVKSRMAENEARAGR
jgi:uncharacterized protein YdhG (YjbR/CyaY superfamily)